MNNESTKILIAASASLVIGGLVGYFVTERVLSAKYEALLDDEVKQVKEFYKSRYSEKKDTGEEDVEDTPLPPKPVVEERIPGERRNSELIEQMGYDGTSDDILENDPDEEEVLTTRSGLPVPPIMYHVPSEDSEEYRSLLAGRDTEKPYIITVAEYMEDNPEYEKECLMYFEEDDTLCDSRNYPIPDVESIVGDDNLSKFGHYSDDDNIVYVRNDRIASDFEIAYNPGSYLSNVAGFRNEDD